ncbi:uncharacterized protein K444DRAFT_565044 [Hyaloscypha bicolor E]|uniref:Uncharacterized protein n=1 Tax=Hyaloscypha bicolor E TaxID=1095630 RepID=A0A2J6T3I9_9HELO|nr:uncharacterized protein K444DRAFT_565044 [Hyaloscypha bicolor E]PMD57585.1 hypothetical protein K444DRAFT_565044 [Hyaloscypha bicolor E]
MSWVSQQRSGRIYEPFSPDLDLTAAIIITGVVLFVLAGETVMRGTARCSSRVKFTVKHTKC